MAGARIDRTGRRLTAVAGGVTVVLGLALGVVATVGRSPVDPFLGSVALAGLVAAPGVLALLGLHGRSVLWLPAGLAAVPLAFFSLAGITLPLLPAGIIFLTAWIRHPRPRTGPRVHPALLTPLIWGLLLGAVIALFISEDPASWTTPTGGGSTSDVITNREALLSLASLALALTAGWTLAPPRPEARTSHAGHGGRAGDDR